MIAEEPKYLPSENYFYPVFQPEITSDQRERQVHWMIGLQKKLKLKPETLFITVNIMDRYLSRKHTSSGQLQLVSITALFIASKFQEIYPPATRDFPQLV